MSTIPEDLQPFKDQIWCWYILHDYTLEETRQKLLESIGFIPNRSPEYPSIRTLYRAIAYWNFRKFNKPVDITHLYGRLHLLFYRMNLSDAEIVRFLQRDGYDLTTRTCVDLYQHVVVPGSGTDFSRLRRIRRSLGMRRRIPRSEWDAHEQLLRTELEKLHKSGQTGLYGRNFYYLSLKRQGIPVARDRMFELVKQLDPIGVWERTFNLFTSPRGRYQTPGPNFVWSIDGHLKMQMYGIEIYAGTDAYSR
jgi:hypothetical protein